MNSDNDTDRISRTWWHEHFGHTFDCLTQSEARYLTRSPDVDTIRNRLAAAEARGKWIEPHRRSPREQKAIHQGVEERV